MATSDIASAQALCQRCGGAFEAYRSSQKNCKPCGYLARIEANKLRRRKLALTAGKAQRPTACIDCASPIPTDAKYHRCPSCWLAAKRKRNRERELRVSRAKGIPAVGSMVECPKCSKQFALRPGPAKLCDPCLREHQLASQREASRRSYVKAAPRVRDPTERYESNKRYHERHPEVRGAPKYKVDHRMRSGVQQAIRKNKAGRSWEALVGYSLAELMAHLERQFVSGMSWDNMGEWHIDHILPLAGFVYEKAEDEGFKAAWAMTNLRPLWSVENQSKGAKRLLLI